MNKDKIKKKFEKQVDGDTMRIPAKAKYDRRKLDDKKLRVAAYCRVSTDSDDQFTSFEAQKEHYVKSISNRPNWELYHVYADEETSLGQKPKIQ